MTEVVVTFDVAILQGDCDEVAPTISAVAGIYNHSIRRHRF